MSFFSLVYEFPHTGNIHRKQNRVHAGTPVFTFMATKFLPNNSAKGTYVDAVVMKFWVFFELVGGVVLVSGQELTQKMAVDVRLCFNVERDTRRVAEAS